MTFELVANDYAKTVATPLFEKRTVAELTDEEMMSVDGGTTPVCAAAVASSTWCVGGALFIGGAVAGYFLGH